MMQKIRWRLLNWLILPALVACQPLIQPLSNREEPTVMPSIATNPQAQQAITDLAERLQIEPQTITVVRVEAVTWPDGSLGCPEPGMMYTQALIDGFFIQLQVGDQSYNYHGGNQGTPTLCESADEVLPEDLGEGPA